MKTFIQFKKLVFILFSFACFTSHAQQHFCHFDSLMLADTLAYQNFYSLQRSILKNKSSEFKHKQHNINIGNTPFFQYLNEKANYIIPIVVHVIHQNKTYGQQNNITNHQIEQQIIQLNDAMKAEDNGIQFCFANKLPNGSSFSGILRHNSNILPYINTNGGLHQLFNTFNLDPERYLNIYVVENFYDRFPQNNISTVKGIGLPKSYDSKQNGVIMRSDYFGNFNQCDSCTLDSTSSGKVFIHEVGHYLGLFHTFHGGCAGNTPETCNNAGDLCCDTPPEDGPHWYCQFDLNTCTETPTDQDDPINNYMSYRQDCWSEFSKNQIELMHLTIEEVYAQMIDVNNLKLTGAVQCGFHTALFSANRLSVCDSGSFVLTALDSGRGLYEWQIFNASNALIANHNSSTSQIFTWKGLLPGSYTVSLTTYNGTESITYTRKLWLKIFNCKNKLQSPNGNWYFGVFAGMNFKSESPMIDNIPKLNDPIAINVYDNTLSQSNDKGGILFYGGQQTFVNNNPYDQRMRLYDKGHFVIPNGDSIYMGSNVISVPRPSYPGQFFIITSSASYPTTYPTAKYVGLYYNVFDTSLRSGSGDVVMSFKNTPVLPPTFYPSGSVSYPGNTALWSSDNLLVIPTCNNREYWLMVQSPLIGNDTMLVYTIQSGAIVFSHVDTMMKKYGLADSKVSPDGRWIFNAGNLYRFNRQNGTLMHVKSLNNIDFDRCAFSPNSKVLYYFDQIGNDYIIKQLDLSNEIRAPYNIYIQSNTHPRMELAPNGKIYIGNAGLTYLSVINHPNIMNSSYAPNACGYESRGFYTKEGNKGGIFQRGLPNTLITAKDSSLKKDMIIIKQSCFKVLFTTSKTCTGTYSWDFGDQTGGSGLEVEHTYASKGIYTVVLNLGSDTVQRTVRIGIDTAGFNFSGIINVCDISKQANYQIKTLHPNLTYVWQVDNGSIVGQSNLNNVNVLWNLSGTNRIRLIATSYEGCKDTIQKTITPRTQISNNTIYMNVNYCDFDTIHGNIPPETDINTIFMWYYKEVGSNTWQSITSNTSSHFLMPFNTNKSYIYTRFAKIDECVFQSNEIQVTTLNHRNVLTKDITDICHPVIRTSGIHNYYTGADVTWQKSTDQTNWENINLNNDSTLTILGLTDTNYFYRRKVEYLNCISYSNIIIGNTIFIAEQPNAIPMCSNNSTILKVKFKLKTDRIGGEFVRLHYRHKDSINWISNLNGVYSVDTILTFNNLEYALNTNFIAKLSFQNPSCGSAIAYTDSFAIDTVANLSVINTLRDTTIAAGEKVLYKVQLTDNKECRYTWQRKNNANGIWDSIPNNNFDSLLYTTNNCYSFIGIRVKIQSPCTTLYSNIATVTVNNLTTPTFDYWMKNSIFDKGNEPDTITTDYMKSQDIWIRHNPDGIKKHEDLNTETDINYVYVTIRNKGKNPTQSAKLFTYWTWGATNESWDLNWTKNSQNVFVQNNGVFTSSYSMGGEINKLGINIPEIPQNDTVNIAIPWTDFPKKGWYDLNSQRWDQQRINICLLARIETCDVAPYGMTFSEQTNVLYNIKHNNNIVSRNTYTLPFKRSLSGVHNPDRNGEQYRTINPNIIDGGTIAVRNNDPNAHTSSICIKTQNIAYFDKAETYIEIGEGLNAVMAWSPLVSYSGLTHVIDNIYQVTSSNACFENVVLPAHFQDMVLPLFAYTDINDRFPDGASFNTSIQQKDSLGYVIGECIFTLTDNLFVNPEPTYIEKDTTFELCDNGVSPTTVVYSVNPALPYVMYDENADAMVATSGNDFELGEGEYTLIAIDSNTFTHYITDIHVHLNEETIVNSQELYPIECESEYYGFGVPYESIRIYNQYNHLVDTVSYNFYELYPITNQYRMEYNNTATCQLEKTTLKLDDMIMSPPSGPSTYLFAKYDRTEDSCAFVKLNNLTCNGDSINYGQTIEIYSMAPQYLFTATVEQYSSLTKGFKFCPPLWNTDEAHIHDWHQMIYKVGVCNYCRIDFKADSTVHFPKVLSVNDLNINPQVSIYPNPSNSQFNLQIKFPNKIHFTIQITDNMGRLIINEIKSINDNGEIPLSLENYSNSIYFIKIPELNFDGKVVLIRE